MAKNPSPTVLPAKGRQIVLERQPDESLAAWEQTLAAITSCGKATVTRQTDGSALICWPAGEAL
ncbi:DUF1654 domain-containing protein [Billgrantia sp. C5P2]|uniref:DUF1654 domain-containing protein n=1 Tax=Billgrantia sp. C5P2 TaxID=3436239 RepID=UPI003DA3ED4D